MTKPQHIDGYDPHQTNRCEQVLVTLLSGLGPWANSLYLVGGLVPRYLVRERPPIVPRHAGSRDVDVVVDLQVFSTTQAYHELSENLQRLGFEPVDPRQGRAWRWRKQERPGEVLLVEFLQEATPGTAGKVVALPEDGVLNALPIEHASMVCDLYESREVTADLLDDNGSITVTVRHANLVSFVCLKAFAFNIRGEYKDAHDLVYCIQHAAPRRDAAEMFKAQLAGKHGSAVRQALDLLRKHFMSDATSEGHLKSGSVKFAKFIDEYAGRDQRLIQQRVAADAVTQLCNAIAERL